MTIALVQGANPARPAEYTSVEVRPHVGSSDYELNWRSIEMRRALGVRAVENQTRLLPDAGLAIDC